VNKSKRTKQTEDRRQLLIVDLILPISFQKSS
jgi:hypothetical protein